MLRELHIRDIALIEDAWVELPAGLTVFTGETGAGKTVLLNALKLIVGERGDTTLIRHGAESARIEAQFDGADGTELVATRQFWAGGRNRCTIDDELVTVARLAELLGPSIDLHGQHDHQALLRPATHGALLDRWAAEDIDEPLTRYREALKQWREAAAQLTQLIADVERSTTEIEAGRIALEDIERIDPQPGEDDALMEQLPALQHAGELVEAINGALDSLRGEDGALDKVGCAGEVLAAVTDFDSRLFEIAQTLQTLSIDLDEASVALRSIADTLEGEDGQLEETLGRLGALDGLKRRFGPSLDLVLERRDRLRTLVALSENSDEELVRAKQQVTYCEQSLAEVAGVLHEKRTIAAHTLASALTEAVATLDMAGASFEIACDSLPFEQFNASGPDRVEILYQPAPTAAMRPLAKIASGGEISRVMLALRGVIGDADEATTLVFDEIDAGIGGATATAVGRRLAQLAQTHQVIVVTHLAQVAAFADTHYVVDKQTTDGEVMTTVSLVEDEARTTEVARMLSGQSGQTALDHARELLAQSRR